MMPPFTIPPEIRLLIAEELDTRTCVDFAMTCRENYRLFASLLATHKRYRTIDTDGAGHLVWDVTKHIIENPKVADYIRDISLPNTRQRIWNENDEDDTGVWPDELDPSSPQRISDKTVQMYLKAAWKIPMVNELFDEEYPHFASGSTWNLEQMIRRGVDYPLAMILCTMAVNITTLRFTQFEPGDLFEDLFRRVSTAYQDPIQAPFLPFQKLTRVAIAYDDTEGCCGAEWALHFLSIPTVKAFAALKMGGEPCESDLPASHAKSNVKELLFQCSFFDAGATEQILERTQAVEVFVYENGGPIISDSGAFTPRAVTKSLLDNAVHSLEKLSLIDSDGFDFEDLEIDYVSLRAFEKLKILRCPWAVLTGEQDEESDDDEMSLPEGEFYTELESKSFDLAARLPRSLEALHLDQCPAYPVYWQALLKLVRESASLFPNLKQVYAHDDTTRSISELKSALKERGLKFEALPEFLTAADNPLAELLEGQGVC